MKMRVENLIVWSKKALWNFAAPEIVGNLQKVAWLMQLRLWIIFLLWYFAWITLTSSLLNYNLPVYIWWWSKEHILIELSLCTVIPLQYELRVPPAHIELFLLIDGWWWTALEIHYKSTRLSWKLISCSQILLLIIWILVVQSTIIILVVRAVSAYWGLILHLSHHMSLFSRGDWTDVIHLWGDYHLLVVGIILIHLNPLLRAMHGCPSIIHASHLSNIIPSRSLNLVLRLCAHDIGVAGLNFRVLLLLNIWRRS